MAVDMECTCVSKIKEVGLRETLSRVGGRREASLLLPSGTLAALLTPVSPPSPTEAESSIWVLEHTCTDSLELGHI